MSDPITMTVVIGSVMLGVGAVKMVSSMFPNAPVFKQLNKVLNNKAFNIAFAVASVATGAYGLISAFSAPAAGTATASGASAASGAASASSAGAKASNLGAGLHMTPSMNAITSGQGLLNVTQSLGGLPAATQAQTAASGGLAIGGAAAQPQTSGLLQQAMAETFQAPLSVPQISQGATAAAAATPSVWNSIQNFGKATVNALITDFKAHPWTTMTALGTMLSTVAKPTETDVARQLVREKLRAEKKLFDYQSGWMVERSKTLGLGEGNQPINLLETYRAVMEGV